MLQYDEEKLIPGELENAEKKAEEIGAQIRESNAKLRELRSWEPYTDHAYLRLTEHVTGKFDISTPWSLWDFLTFDNFPEFRHLRPPLERLWDKIAYTMQYDNEWLLPGELEYAEQKAEEIKSQVDKFHARYNNFKGEKGTVYDLPVHIPLTEHITGEFIVKTPEYSWSVSGPGEFTFQKLKWFQENIAPIEPPKYFALPDGDIRGRLPEWDDRLLAKESLENIMEIHSVRYSVLKTMETLDGYYGYLTRNDLKLDDAKREKVLKSLVEKLSANEKGAAFTDKETELALEMWKNHDFPGTTFLRYEPWRFPLEMDEQDIIEAVREAYESASKRSRRRVPDEVDFSNLGVHPADELSIKNYECLYQGRAGDMTIRFLFDYKNMRIKMAYPVFKEARLSCYFKRRY